MRTRNSGGTTRRCTTRRPFDEEGRDEEPAGTTRRDPTRRMVDEKCPDEEGCECEEYDGSPYERRCH
jgi:hypothetical protein